MLKLEHLLIKDLKMNSTEYKTNQLLQLCTARTALSDSVIRSAKIGYRSILPTTNKQLVPKVVNFQKLKQELRKRQERQKQYFDVGSKPLNPLKIGDSMRMKHNSHIWQPAVVTGKHADRSYVVQTEAGNQYGRNRRFLQKTGESHEFNISDGFNPFDSGPPVPKDSPKPPIT